MFIDDKDLVMQVTDNGFGIKSERLKKILKVEPSNKRTSGVGLKNVNERIQLSYGNEYGVSIKSKIEIGTTVSIKIPLVWNEKEDNDESSE